MRRPLALAFYLGFVITMGGCVYPVDYSAPVYGDVSAYGGPVYGPSYYYDPFYYPFGFYGSYTYIKHGHRHDRHVGPSYRHDGRRGDWDAKGRQGNHQFRHDRRDRHDYADRNSRQWNRHGNDDRPGRYGHRDGGEGSRRGSGGWGQLKCAGGRC